MKVPKLWQRKFMSLVAGPALLMLLGFVAAGEWGLLIGLFLGIAALIFVPTFGALLSWTGAKTLPSTVMLANSVPLAWWAINCPLIGNSCPNYTWNAAAPWYFAATFCAVVFWAFNRRRG